MALLSSNFADILDVRFRRIFHDQYDELADRVGDFYSMQTSDRNNERLSSVGTYGDIPQFTGTVTYADVSQGYDATYTHLEWAAGIQIERALFDDDQFAIIDSRPKGMAQSANRLRQTHSARAFNNAFSIDTLFYSHTEGVALCSNSHTTTSGASVASGFDNLVTTGLSATALAAARVQMIGYRGDQAERISVMPDTILIPPDLYDLAYEIVGSQGKPGVATNDANVHYGQYKVSEWNYLTDTNNWFLMDSAMMKSGYGLLWYDRVKPEFAFVESFDELIGKWRVYFRYSLGHYDWRWLLGAQVS